MQDKGGTMKFPAVVGKNLLRQSVRLPQDLEADINLLFVPFLQWQQGEVDNWVPFVQGFAGSISNFDFFELPTIEARGKLTQWFINEGMRAGIPNNATRSRTITLYLDKKKFHKVLDMPDEEHIYLLLVNRAGEILYRERGDFSPEKGKNLQDELIKLTKKKKAES
jgi:hypothetical protein